MKFYKNKILHVFFITSLYFIMFFVTSCASSGSIIPGENKANIQNIFIEYMNIADSYLSQQNYDKAITYYNKALNNKDIYWTVYYKLAKTYALKANWDEAEKMYNKLISRDSDNMSLKASLAYIYAMKSDFDRAEEIYLELYNKLPDDAGNLENYISISLLNNDFDKAQLLLDELKSKFPENTNIEKFETEINKTNTSIEEESSEN